MKTLGLIGGMSWESTVTYYQLINRGVARELGGLHSAKILLASLDFEEIAAMQREERWEEAAAMLAGAAKGLRDSGADAVMICTNTMHVAAPTIEVAVDIPLLHIVDATGDALRKAGVSRVGLLGTRFTMEQPFYRDRLANNFGLDVIVPPLAQREDVHRIIYDELCQGTIHDISRSRYLETIAGLVEGGAEAVVLGCTEIGLLVGENDTDVPLFDTTRLHAAAAVRFALD